MKKRFISAVLRMVLEIAVVGAASIVVIFALQTLHRPNIPVSPPSMHGPLLAVGSPVSIKSVEFGSRPVTLLLVSSPSCHFCIASKNFHKSLIVAAESHNIPLFFSIPDPASSRAYITDFGLRPGRLKAWSDVLGSVEGTPTLLAVDSSGHVAHLWVGELAPGDEKAVLEIVRSGTLPLSTAAAPNDDVQDFSLAALNRLRRIKKLDVIDVRERTDVRGLPPGITNIPLQEIPFRIAYDITPDVFHIIDCRASTPDLCEQARQIFKRAGLRVGTTGHGAYQGSWCRATLLKK